MALPLISKAFFCGDPQTVISYANKLHRFINSDTHLQRFEHLDSGDLTDLASAIEDHSFRLESAHLN
jgi:hypothetical protein